MHFGAFKRTVENMHFSMAGLNGSIRLEESISLFFMKVTLLAVLLSHHVQLFLSFFNLLRFLRVEPFGTPRNNFLTVLKIIQI